MGSWSSLLEELSYTIPNAGEPRTTGVILAEVIFASANMPLHTLSILSERVATLIWGPRAALVTVVPYSILLVKCTCSGR